MRDWLSVAGLIGPSFLLLCACAAPAAPSRRKALIGKSAEDLLRCAGVPERTVRRDGGAVWTYSSKTGNCSAAVEFGTDDIVGVTYRAAGEGPVDSCPGLFESCVSDVKEEAQAKSGRCPEGWASKKNEPCYPVHAIFGDSTK